MTDTITASAARQATVGRAIALIGSAKPADLAGYLAKTDLHAHWKDNPAALRDSLITAGAPGPSFGAWKAAQQILDAAGLPVR